MEIKFTNEDFSNLQKIKTINQNKNFFSEAKGYANTSIKRKVKGLQKPLWNKMKSLKNSLLDEPYFNKRFDIIESRPNKQSTKTVKGPIRSLVWISLVPWSELSKSKHNTYSHQRLPQIQVSFQRDKFIVASVWLDGDGCEQKYRARLFDYLRRNKIDDRYKIKIHKKREEKAEFEGIYKKFKMVKTEKFLNDKSYSLGIEKILSIGETVNLGDQIYSTIVDEIQTINEKIFAPCFNFKISQSTLKKVQSDRIKRKAKLKFEIKNSLRKGTEPTIVTKKHEEIQKILQDHFTDQYKGTGIVTKFEEDFVDIKIEDAANGTLILYEIKTNKSALNCLKNGLGQLLFYAMKNKNENKKHIELVIIGLNKMTSEAKKFVTSIKEFLGPDNFRYQRFDENTGKLLSELKS